MKRAVKMLVFLVIILMVVTVAYTLYANFLVDYSLENLAVALKVTDRKTEESSVASQRLYTALLEDLALETVSREDVDLRELALLEVASRSLEEGSDKAGQARAKIYLAQSLASRKMLRHQLLRFADQIFHFFRKFLEQVFGIMRYLKKQIAPGREESREIAGLLLLTQAEEKEKRWELDEAADLYRRFLKFYPDHPDNAFVTVTLAHVLLKQKKYHEAERLLRGLAMEKTGIEAHQIAAGLLRKIDALKKSEVRIAELKRDAAESEGTVEGEIFQLKLALEYLKAYSLDESQKILQKLVRAEDPKIRAKAKFYRAWIYKLQAQYDQGADILLELIEGEDLDDELMLGLNAQLADIYYEQKDRSAALYYYQKLSSEIKNDEADLSKYAGSLKNYGFGDRASREAFAALADTESATIYYTDYQDSDRGKSHLEQTFDGMPKFGKYNELRQELKKAASLELRELAFRNLEQAKILRAEELFKKKLKKDPKDAWSYAGLATVYVLLRDLYQARLNAERAFAIGPDEYTASVLAWVLNYLGENDKAIHLYRKALEHAPGGDYIPAQYNLAYNYLKEKRYEEARDLLQGLELAFQGYSGHLRSKILNNLGYALWWLGEQEQAVLHFQDALKDTPEMEEARMNLDEVLSGGPPQHMNRIE